MGNRDLVLINSLDRCFGGKTRYLLGPMKTRKVVSFCDYIDGGGTREIVCAPERNRVTRFSLGFSPPRKYKTFGNTH